MEHIQKLGHFGIGIEATAGTLVSPTYWLQLSDDPSVKDNYEYKNIETSRGRVETSQGQKIMRKSGEGDVQVHVDEEAAPLFIGLMLGSTVSASAGSGVYEHTITTANTNQAKTASLYLDRVVDQLKFPCSVLSELAIGVSEDFATFDLSFVSYPSASSTAETPAYTEETHFAFHEMAVRFGADVAAAEAAEPTPLSEFELTLTREASPVFESNSSVARKIPRLGFTMEGTYSLVFKDTTQLNKYLNNTKNAMVVTFSTGNKFIKLILSNVLLSNHEPDNALDDLVVEEAEFGAHYDSTEGEGMRAVVRNNTASYTNL